MLAALLLTQWLVFVQAKERGAQEEVEVKKRGAQKAVEPKERGAQKQVCLPALKHVHVFHESIGSNSWLDETCSLIWCLSRKFTK